MTHVILEFIHTSAFSFFSTSTYQRVRHRWSGYGMKYIMFLLLLCSAASSIVLSNNIVSSLEPSPEFPNTLSPSLLHIINQIPEFEIKNGTISSDKESTYIITPLESDNPLIVLDTTNILKSVTETTARILITPTYVSFIDSSGDAYNMPNQEFLQSLGLNPNKNYKVNHAALIEFTTKLSDQRDQIPYLIFVSFWIINLLRYAVNILIFASIGSLIAHFLKSPIDFKTAMRLAAVAATPMILIKTFGFLIGSTLFSTPATVYFLMHLAYVYYAVECSKPPRADETV